MKDFLAIDLIDGKTNNVGFIELLKLSNRNLDHPEKRKVALATLKVLYINIARGSVDDIVTIKSQVEYLEKRLIDERHSLVSVWIKTGVVEY